MPRIAEKIHPITPLSTRAWSPRRWLNCRRRQSAERARDEQRDRQDADQPVGKIMDDRHRRLHGSFP
jgi:hypothetical protein